MFGISYDSWKKACVMCFEIKAGKLKSYLQTFPFSQLSTADREYISGQFFFDAFINNGEFVIFKENLQIFDNYMQKADGSFRNSSLVTPILFLLIQAIGIEIANKYISIRPNNISIYYSGNLLEGKAFYKQEYDDFFKEINSVASYYQYFIKTDISNFYANINLNELFAQVDQVVNKDGTNITQLCLFLYNNLLSYCGKGRFPIIENNAALSFLATVVYLDRVDQKLDAYIRTKVRNLREYKIIRYVDDMYIFFSPIKSYSKINTIYNEIKNEYSSLLKDLGLSLNASKCCIKSSGNINEELKKSLYDEFTNGFKCDISNAFKGKFLEFIKSIYESISEDSFTNEKYISIMQKCFSADGIIFTPSEVFNYFLYEKTKELSSAAVVQIIVKIIKKNVLFVSIDPKRLTTMILQTKSEDAIKAFLKCLFERFRNDKWNSYDTTIAISYLLQRKFEHSDLLEILKVKCCEFYKYYLVFCKKSFIQNTHEKTLDKIRKVICGDNKYCIMYFMYLYSLQKKDFMSAFAYYKNSFDRITAHFALATGTGGKNKKPNYRSFYKEKTLIEYYKGVENSETIIETANKIRNENPLAHSSAEILDKNASQKEICDSISGLQSIIENFVQLLPELL